MKNPSFTYVLQNNICVYTYKYSDDNFFLQADFSNCDIDLSLFIAQNDKYKELLPNLTDFQKTLCGFLRHVKKLVDIPDKTIKKVFTDLKVKELSKSEFDIVFKLKPKLPIKEEDLDKSLSI